MPNRPLRFVLLLAVFALACAAARPPAPAPNAEAVKRLAPRPVEAAPAALNDLPKELARVRFAAVGDVLPHVSVKLSADRWNQKGPGGESLNNGGWDPLLAGIVPALAGVDLAFANLETPVSPSGDKGTVEFHFNAPPVMLAGLKKAGFGLVSFANNHVYDQGYRGMVETLDELEKVAIPQAGAGRTRAEAYKGLRLEKNGIRIAVLGASQFFNNSGAAASDPDKAHVNKTDDPAAMEEAVRAARAEADFVIVSAHWGVEYQPKPRESEIELAHRLFEAGADVILGTHPHVLQPIEVYSASDGRTCLVVYSLGNFISNQSRHYVHGVSPSSVGDSRDSALLRFAIVKRDHGAGGIRAELADVSYVPLWQENDFVGRAKGALPDIRVVTIAAALAHTRRELEEATAKAGPKPARAAQDQIVRLKKRIAMLEKRREVIEARLGTDFSADLPR